MNKFFSGGFLYNPEKKEILLHKRDGNTAINPHKWAFFGGSSEGEETPLQTFMREIHEELGIVLSEAEIIALCDYLNVERNTHRYVFYVVSDKKKEEMILGEGADFDWIPLSKVFEYDLTDMTRDDITTLIETKS
ncbi:MAG: NUDIX domain-containing protein [Candidatus Paceibacteria bacterium]